MLINYRELDWKLIAAAAALTLIGVVLIYSAHYHSESVFKQTYYLRQLMWFGVSLVAVAIAVNVPVRVLDASAYLMYGLAILLLVAVLLFGDTRLGATRWFALGPVSVTPSDIAKLALLLTLARFFAYLRSSPMSARKIIGSSLLVLGPVALIMKQPDLGTSLVFIALLVGLWFWSGIHPAYLALLLSPGISLIASVNTVAWVAYFVLLLALLLYLKPSLIWASTAVVVNLACGVLLPFLWNGLHDYQQDRILTFLDPGQDPRGAGYQIIQSRISIGSGGFWGKGFLNSTQSRLEFLPERHTDFVFSILGEEFGFVGAVIVLGLFLFLLYRMVRIALRCRSKFSSYLTFGAATIMLFQMFVNIGMTIGVMPVTGLPLPFISYGGTSLLFNWMLVALALRCDYSWQEY